MRGKKATMLRRLAEEQTQGAPSRNYKKSNQGPIIHYNCTRAVYNHLKKLYKQGILRIDHG
jgi:hypothetical protein